MSKILKWKCEEGMNRLEHCLIAKSAVYKRNKAVGRLACQRGLTSCLLHYTLTEREPYRFPLPLPERYYFFCPLLPPSFQTDVCLKTLPIPQRPENHFLKARMGLKWIFRNVILALFRLSAASHYSGSSRSCFVLGKTRMLYKRKRWLENIPNFILSASQLEGNSLRGPELGLCFGQSSCGTS
jgi:hypothetical protein